MSAKVTIKIEQVAGSETISLSYSTVHIPLSDLSSYVEPIVAQVMPWVKPTFSSEELTTIVDMEFCRSENSQHVNAVTFDIHRTLPNKPDKKEDIDKVLLEQYNHLQAYLTKLMGESLFENVLEAMPKHKIFVERCDN